MNTFDKELLYDSAFMQIFYFPAENILYNIWKTNSILMCHLQNEMIIWRNFFLEKETTNIITNNSIRQNLASEQGLWINTFLSELFRNKKIRWGVIMPIEDEWSLKGIDSMLQLNPENVEWTFFSSINSDVFDWINEKKS